MVDELILLANIIITNDTNASYNALTIALRQRMSSGLELLAHYTWSHTLDISSNSNDDLLDAVAWAAQQGVTSKDSVCIMGGSLFVAHVALWATHEDGASD